MIMSYMCFTVETGIELLRPLQTKHLDDNMEEKPIWDIVHLHYRHTYSLCVSSYFSNFFEVVYALVMVMVKNSRVSQN